LTTEFVLRVLAIDKKEMPKMIPAIIPPKENIMIFNKAFSPLIGSKYPNTKRGKDTL
jgi:hypothetical protein